MIALPGESHWGAPPGCFLCDGALAGEIADYWIGADSLAIALHAECAGQFGAHLIGGASGHGGA